MHATDGSSQALTPTPGGSGALVAPQCNRKARPPKGEPGQPAINDNPGPLAGLAGSEPRRPDTSMENQTAGAGRCFAHRTRSASCLPTA